MAVYKCKTWFDCINAVAEKIKNRGENLDNPTLVICEDKLTLAVETQICELSGGSFSTEVCSLGRYAKKRLPQMNALSKEGAAMTVKKVLTQIAPRLEALKRVASSPSLASETSELIAQLKSAKITPEELKNAADGLIGRSAAKIRDVARIFAAYEDYLKSHGLTDSGDALGNVVKAVEVDEAVGRSSVMFLGLSSLTRQTAEAVEKFADKAKSVDFYVVYGDNKDLYTNEFYSFCKKYDLDPKDAPTALTSEGEIIVNGLFDPAAYAKSGVKTNKIFEYEGADVADEADFIAARIRFEVIEKGYRYKDVAIGLGDYEEYALTLTDKLNDYGIPYFSDEKRTLSTLPVARLINSLLKAPLRGGDLREVQNVISSALFISSKRLSDDIIRRMIYESATYKSFIAGKFAVGDLFCDAKINLLTAALRSIKQNDTAKNYVSLIRKFLTDCGATENGETCARELETADALDESALIYCENADFDGVLTEIETVLGDEPLSLDEFRRILIAGEQACEISSIPQRNDCVYVGELKNCRFKQYKLLIAGGLSGEVPRVKGDAAILMDDDIADLESLSLLIEPKIRVVNDREKEATGVALSSFKEELILTRPLLSSSGAPTVKSRILESTEKLFTPENGKFVIFSRADMEMQKSKASESRRDKLAAFWYGAPRPALFSLLKACDDYKEGAKNDLAEASACYAALKRTGNGKYAEAADALISKMNEKEIFTDLPASDYFADGRVSASILECFYSCPYKCFMRYCLGAADSVTGDARSLDYGNVLHAVAENFVKNIGEIQSEDDAKQAAEKIAEDILSADVYRRFLKKADYAYSFKLLRAEAQKLCARLYREYTLSDFKSDGEEVWFADWAEIKALPIHSKNGTFKLFGKVDRVDEYKNYVRIIDYKTGRAEDKVKDKQFYTGQNVQLYLYMNAFARGGKIPAGAYYYSLDDSFTISGERSISMYGKTLKTEEVIRATDKNFYENRKSEIISGTLRSTKNGETLGGTSFAEEEVLRGYMQYAKTLAEKAVDYVTDGLTAPSPYAGACDYCEYGSACKFDPSIEKAREVADKITAAEIVAAAEYEKKRKREEKNENGEQ